MNISQEYGRAAGAVVSSSRTRTVVVLLIKHIRGKTQSTEHAHNLRLKENPQYCTSLVCITPISIYFIFIIPLPDYQVHRITLALRV